jgi:hypothetical protein
MRISFRELAAMDVLAGAENGRRLLAKLVEMTGRDPQAAETLFLDFAGIEVATASFLRESVLLFRDAVRNRRSNFYPVIANANDLIAEELRLLCSSRGEVIMLCTLRDNGSVADPHIAGELDPKQSITFNLVQERGETDAAELMREHGEGEGVKQTAWNNRLATLANLGLVVEISQGRAKRYKPVFTR